MEICPSGSYDPRNTRVTYEANEKKFTVYAMDGTIRIYRLNENGCRPPNWDWYFYVLEKEILPNGKVIKYHFNGGLRPKYIESLDPQERYVYASIRLSLATGGGRHFLSSSGTTADYSFKEDRDWLAYQEGDGGKRVFFHAYLGAEPLLCERMHRARPPLFDDLLFRAEAAF